MFLFRTKIVRKAEIRAKIAENSAGKGKYQAFRAKNTKIGAARAALKNVEWEYFARGFIDKNDYICANMGL